MLQTELACNTYPNLSVSLRMNETAKENGFIPGMAREMTGAHRPQNMDIKLLHAKKQQGSIPYLKSTQFFKFLGIFMKSYQDYQGCTKGTFPEKIKIG